MADTTQRRTFMDRAVAGEIPADRLEDEIDDAIDAWHSGDGFGYSLAAYLGLSEAEYKAWVEGSSDLEEIAESRRGMARP